MIRPLGIHELDSLESAAFEFYSSSNFLEEFNLARFREIWNLLLGNGSGVIFAEDRNGEMAGAMGGIVHRDIYGEKLIAEEMFWFVKREARGAGIGLYREFERWAVAKGASTLQMVHLLDLMPEKVGNFYLRAGFHPIETRYSKRLSA